jgi:hypothetical protein
MVVALLALFVALGGSSYAALKITGKNIKNGTVTSADLKNNSVRSIDVRNGSLRSKDFKTGELPQGPPGPQGPKGDTGPAGPLLDTLPSGRTLRGTFGMYGHGEINNGLEAASESVSFPIPLASAPSVKVVQDGTASAPPECPGTAADPTAAPGWLCVYENRAQNQRPGSYPSVTAPGSGFSPSASRFGATLIVQGQGAGTDWFYWSEGTWAVTAQ